MSSHMRQADAIFSQLIRERDKRCVNCGASRRLECAHIISRSYKTIRTDPRNAVALCRECHRRFTEHPAEWHAWVEARWPGLWDELREQAMTYRRVDWKERIRELRGAA